MIRIVITGAECTGKTTLAAALSGYYGEPWTAEFARQYVDAQKGVLTSDDVEPIARGQLAQEDAPLGKAKRLLLHDTNLLSTIIYANHYYGKRLNWLNDTFLSRDYTHYLLCSPEGIPWQAEPGQRDSPETRERLHKAFCESLQRVQLSHTVLGGPRDQRFGQAIVKIEGLLRK